MNEEQRFLDNYRKVNGLEHAKRVFEILEDNDVEIPYGTAKEVEIIIDSINSLNLYNLIKTSEIQLETQQETLKEILKNSKSQKRQFILATLISLTALSFSLDLNEIIINLLK